LLNLLGSLLPALAVFAILVTGCTYPSMTDPGDGFASGTPAAETSVAAKPRFSQGGPDAESYGGSDGYPIGARGACQRLVFLVGCQSHFDQVYEGRLVRRATTPSSLARAPSEPAVRYEYQGQTFTLDDYLAHNPATGSSSLVVTRSSSSAISTCGTTGTASLRGRWPRR
jgi:hypothetical protein